MDSSLKFPRTSGTFPEMLPRISQHFPVFPRHILYKFPHRRSCIVTISSSLIIFEQQLKQSKSRVCTKDAFTISTTMFDPKQYDYQSISQDDDDLGSLGNLGNALISSRFFHRIMYLCKNTHFFVIQQNVFSLSDQQTVTNGTLNVNLSESICLSIIYKILSEALFKNPISITIFPGSQAAGKSGKCFNILTDFSQNHIFL